MEASWDDLKLFLYVAEGGGLSAAAIRTGVSAPTIGRRMLALERTMNRMLFERSPRGYELAKDGLALLAQVREMERVSADISAWHGGAFETPFVGIAGDAWLSDFLARHSAALSTGPGDIRFCCMDAHAGLNMINRDCDIAVITDPPHAGNFAVRPSIPLAFAIYQSPKLGSAEDRPWVSMGKEDARYPADRWVFERYDLGIYGWTNSSHVLLEMIASGQGRGVLPCFVGDGRDDLERCGDVIEELNARLHIVVNDDDRGRPEVRLMMDRVTDLLGDHAARFAGRPS